MDQDPGSVPHATVQQGAGKQTAHRHRRIGLSDETERLLSARSSDLRRGSRERARCADSGHSQDQDRTAGIDPERSFGRIDARYPPLKTVSATTKRCRRVVTAVAPCATLAITQNCLSSPTIRSFAEWCGRPLPSILLPVAVVSGRKTEGETA